MATSQVNSLRQFDYLALMFKKLTFSAIFFTFIFCNSAYSQVEIDQRPMALDEPDNSRPKNVYDWNIWHTPDFDDLHNSSDPNYWKNKKPYEGYWQQDVYYKIHAYLNDTFEYIKGGERITYYNNSPNAITEAYFNLYQNAFIKKSLTNELYKLNKTKVVNGKYESENKGIEITSFTINNEPIDFEIYNTILKIKLPKPLLPGEKIDFNIDFITYFDRGSIRRRMKVFDHHGYKHFNGCQWFPKICVYDRKFTWATDQHLEKEFYGDFGVFDVQLDLPENYIVEATGELKNRKTVLPDSLRKKLDIANFAKKPIGEQPSVIIQPSNKRKQWWFHATNVHDFAWTADPTYRISETKFNGVNCVAIAQENNAAGWQQTSGFVKKIIELFSKDFGQYNYPKIVAADAGDGMEYPMITMDGGTYPGHQSLLIHEIGHNWFYGMVGSNETYRAALDEGFTQFLTAWGLKKLTNENFPEYGRAYAGYIEDAIDANDSKLNTHSNEFNGATGHGGGYKHVYLKTATMLYNLQYFLGDSVFSAAMKNYVSQWKFCHPYIEDFRNSVIQSAQADLNKFFDQWFETTDACDYGIKKVKKISALTYQITIERKGLMVMPVNLDLVFVSKLTGKPTIIKNTIPVTFYQNPERQNLAPWLGWDRIKPEYTFQINTPPNYSLEQIFLDGSYRLADIDRSDNVWKHRNSIDFDFINGSDDSYFGGYKTLWRPSVTFNPFNGWMAGLKLSGQYQGRKHVYDLETFYSLNKQPLSADVLVNRGTQPLSYNFNYAHTVAKNGTYFVESKYYNNLFINKLGWKMKVENHTFGIYGKYMKNYFRETFDESNPSSIFHTNYNNYVLGQSFWSNQDNISLNLFWTKTYAGWGRYGSFNVNTRLPSPWSQTQFGFVQGTWKHNQPLGKLLLKTRVFGQYGGGQSPTAESALYAAGANPEDMMDNKLMRDFGFIRLNQAQFLQYGGGLNLRGYINSPIALKQNDTSIAFYRGNSGISANVEIDFTRFFSGVPKLQWINIQTYLFGDAGIISQPVNQKQLTSPIIADAGIGAMVNLKANKKVVFKKSTYQKSILSEVNPLRLRIDIPFFKNITNNNENNLQFRIRFGIERAF